MAQRIVGKYSPNAASGPQEPAVIEAAPPPGGPMLKANLTFLLPFPFIFKAFAGTPTALFSGLGAAGLLILAAWLTREGVKAHAAFDAKWPHSLVSRAGGRHTVALTVDGLP